MLPPLEIEIKADPDDAEVGFGRVEKSLDALDAATNKYNADLAKLNKAVKDGFVSSARHAALLEEIEQEYKQAASAAAAYSKATVVATRNAKNMAGGIRSLSTVTRGGAGGIQNASYQISDFATQVGAGTSASIALGQQLPQLLSGFGALGAVMGAVVAVGVPLGASLLRISTDAQDASDAVSELADAANRLAASNRLAGSSLASLADDYGTLTLEARDLLALQRKLDEIAAQRATAAASRSLGQEFGISGFEGINPEALRLGSEALETYTDGLAETYLELQRINAESDVYSQSIADRASAIEQELTQIKRLGSNLDDLAKMLGTTRDGAADVAAAMVEMGQAEGPQAQAEAMRRLAEKIFKATDGFREGDDEAFKLYQQLLEAAAAATRVAANASDISSNITTSADEAARLKDELWKAAAVKYARESGRYSGRGSDPRMFDTEGRLGGGFVPSQEIIDQANAILNPRSSGGRRAGGRSAGGRGSAVNPLVGDIEQLRKALATETETIAQTYVQRQEILNSALEQEMISQQEHYDLMQRAAQDHASAMAAAKQQEADMIRAASSGMYSELAGLLGQFSQKSKLAAKAQIAINTALRVAEIRQNTAAAAMRALAELGPVAGPPAAAKITAFGNAQAALAAAAGAASALGSGGGGGASGGGGSGGGGGGATAATAGGGEGPLQVRMESIDPNALFTGGSIGTLLERLQDEAGDRGIQFVGGGIA